MDKVGNILEIVGGSFLVFIGGFGIYDFIQCMLSGDKPMSLTYGVACAFFGIVFIASGIRGLKGKW